MEMIIYFKNTFPPLPMFGHLIKKGKFTWKRRVKNRRVKKELNENKRILKDLFPLCTLRDGGLILFERKALKMELQDFILFY